ncbi:hypothetical protein [Granulicella mallensis]|uniref:Uncharacterized protein n=1 Tax=Granulicella mallensis TaxID=940614 RepID=A0A7W7ZVN0_9BACT|nr:hypothetical protein [Granulicella mallensis]MBB5066071.1 hypothetical protein [Granulicella mallensis]
MQCFESQSGQFMRVAACLGTVLFLGWLAGCSSSPIPATQAAAPAPAPSVQTYFAPYVFGSSAGQSPLTYTLDDVGLAFSQTTYQPQTQPGPQVLNAGSFTISQRGLRTLGITATYNEIINNGTPSYEGTAYNPSKPGSFAVELAGQAGGLVQLVGQPVQPLVAATQCPSFSSAQTYQFVTIPSTESKQLLTGLPGQPPIYQPLNIWNPATDTAYGSVDVVSSGSTVTFQNIQQYRLPSEVAADGKGTSPAQSPSSSVPVPGACGPTFFGNITNVPGQLVITDPGGQDESNPPQAVVGIGSTGLLVEDNGHTGQGFLPHTAPALQYNNVLGAGTGAVGLPKPSSPLDTSTVVGKQYLGFIYEAGNNDQGVTWSSNLASFGFPSVPTGSTGCPSVDADASSSTLIYGGDFPVNLTTGLPDPGSDNHQNPNYPYGNNDFVIDLGPQDTSNNGLYRQAKVCVGKMYPGNSTGAAYPFQAVAIAGQLGSQYAIFLIGLDSTQPWAIYLLQSN